MKSERTKRIEDEVVVKLKKPVIATADSGDIALEEQSITKFM
jgi:hypothetical protein